MNFILQKLFFKLFFFSLLLSFSLSLGGTRVGECVLWCVLLVLIAPSIPLLVFLFSPFLLFLNGILEVERERERNIILFLLVFCPFLFIKEKRKFLKYQRNKGFESIAFIVTSKFLVNLKFNCL